MEKDFNPLLAAIKIGLKARNSLTLAIDGPCASGKTSLADRLQAEFDARVIPMDHFFLPADLRTKERYATPGGNVHLERFLKDVAPCLEGGHKSSEINYRPFDCRTMTYGQQKSLPFAPLTIIEGTYSLHWSLRHLYDLKVLLKISEEEQTRRLLSREGPQGFEVFKNRWIPMENLYFSRAELESICDFII
jgi:uridine kinase